MQVVSGRKVAVDWAVPTKQFAASQPKKAGPGLFLLVPGTGSNMHSLYYHHLSASRFIPHFPNDVMRDMRGTTTGRQPWGCKLSGVALFLQHISWQPCCMT